MDVLYIWKFTNDAPILCNFQFPSHHWLNSQSVPENPASISSTISEESVEFSGAYTQHKTGLQSSQFEVWSEQEEIAREVSHHGKFSWTSLARSLRDIIFRNTLGHKTEVKSSYHTYIYHSYLTSFLKVAIYKISPLVNSYNEVQQNLSSTIKLFSASRPEALKAQLHTLHRLQTRTPIDYPK